MKAIFSLLTPLLLLFVACGEKSKERNSHTPQLPGSSLLENTPDTFVEIVANSLQNGANYRVSNPEKLPLGWRFSLPQKGILRVSIPSTELTCNGDAQMSFVIRTLGDNGLLSADILADLNANSEVTLGAGSYAVVLGKAPSVQCSRFEMSFGLKLELPQNSDDATPASHEVTFEGFHHIQEVEGGSTTPDTAALFIIRASSGKIIPDSQRGPAFLKEVSIDTVSQATVGKLFRRSSVPPPQLGKPTFCSDLRGELCSILEITHLGSAMAKSTRSASNSMSREDVRTRRFGVFEPCGNSKAPVVFTPRVFWL